MIRAAKAGHATEDQEQASLVEWIDRCTPFVPLLENFTAIPNGGARPSKRNPKTGARYSVEAQKLKRLGVRKGYPDVLLDVAAGGFHGLRVELKTVVGKASPEQLEWIDRLRMQGYRAVVCRGWQDAAGVFCAYLASLLDAQQRAKMLSMVGRRN